MQRMQPVWVMRLAISLAYYHKTRQNMIGVTSDQHLFSLTKSKYSILIISVFLVLLAIENVDAIVARFLAQFNTSTAGMTLFVIISIGYIVGQFILLRFMNSSSHTIKVRSSLVSNLHKDCFNSAVGVSWKRNFINYSNGSFF